VLPLRYRQYFVLQIPFFLAVVPGHGGGIPRPRTFNRRPRQRQRIDSVRSRLQLLRGKNNIAIYGLNREGSCVFCFDFVPNLSMSPFRRPLPSTLDGIHQSMDS